MNNSNIHKSLVELEENLKNLESARTSVDTVSAKSEQVVIAFTKILTQIEFLQNEFKDEKSGFGHAITQSIESFNSTIDIKTKDFVKKTEGLNDDISSSVDDTLQKLNSFQMDIEEAAKGIHNFDFEKNFNELKSLLSETNLQLDALKKDGAENWLAISNQIELFKQNHFKDSRQKLIVTAVGFIAVIALLFILN